nr:reverse transcriptase domain-containing protein [Tanacetum cinerariifolium]
MAPPTNNKSTKDVQPRVVQVETPMLNSKPIVAPIFEPVEAPVSTSKPKLKPSIPYPSRLHDQKLRDKANDQKEKFFQIFQDLNFNISFADALILLTIKSLLTNKDKLFELARTPMNEHCSAVILKKLPEKLGDPSKFLIPCDFPRMDECLALADLDASINLMPLSVWNKISFPEPSPTCMTLELTDRLISRPIGVAKDVFVKVGTFHFSADFVVVDFDADPRVPLILRRSFLKTGCTLIDVYEEELTLQVLGFSVSGNPTPSTKPIVSISSPTLTPFGDSDFLFEETDAFLAIDDEPISPKIDNSYYDSEGDILLLEEFLNDDPLSSPLHPQELKGDDKFPVIIAKDLKDWEKIALIKVLKSHKQALAWQLSDIKDTFQRRMMAIFHDMIEKTMEVFMDDFSDFENSFGTCLSHLDKMLKRCEDTNLCLNWVNSHFMVKEGIILGHKISKNKIEVDKAKVDVIAKLPHPTTIKEKTKRIHDSKIKDRVFNLGDRVLLFNSRLKIFSSKLKTHWSVPFTMTQVFPDDIVELSQTDGPNFKVNGHRLKHYFGKDIPKMVVPDL